MNIKKFISLFNSDEQYIRLYDLANDYAVCFEGQISEMDHSFDDCKIIMFDTIYEFEFDGYFGIFIATKNENKYYEMYNDEDED